MIGSVSESLKQLLETEMTSAAKVTLLSPADESPALTRINLFAYRLVPNPHLLNRGVQPIPGLPDRVKAPPLGLSVFYLMTAHSPADPETGHVDAHSLLGDAMRVLWERAVIPAEHLQDGLLPGTLKATLQLVDVDEVSRVWTALSQPFQLCAIYEVATVDLEALDEKPLATRTARTEIGMAAAVPTTTAPTGGTAP